MTPSVAGPEVALLDYEMSNLRSVGKALEKLGARVRIATRPDEAIGAGALVLPGVGRFGAAMERLDHHGFPALLRRSAMEGVPILGICLGQQLLFDESDESPGIQGLGILRGRVERLCTPPKVPNIGWREVAWRSGAGIAPQGDDVPPAESTYYFVHSYSCVPADEGHVLGTARHGVPFVAAAGHGSVTGVQFHPEKSSTAGLALLGRWLDGVRERARVSVAA